jgi:signal recognition particle receptor subunit beta
MVFFNYATMQMAAKIVYYGPGLCGKTTNLHHIYTKTSPQSRGEMVSLETETDRTLFFDLLPIDVGVIGGFKTRLQLYTVPGQVFYNTTRKLVLKGVDGIVFVADSQAAMLDACVDSLKNLRENLAEIGLDLDEIPVVLQFNKRDLPNVAPVEDMLNALDPDRRFEHVESVAATGIGVFETLKLISKLTLRQLRRRMTGEDPVKAASPQPRSGTQFRVREETGTSTRTIAAETPIPAVAKARTTTAPIPAYGGSAAASTVAEPHAEAAQVAPAPDTLEENAAVVPDLDRRIIADAPVAAAPAEEPEMLSIGDEVVEEIAEEAVVGDTVAEAAQPATTEYVPPPAAPEPEIDFSQTAQPQKVEPEVKTVKVRSSVDVMAELEALRKRATNVTPKTAKRDILADLDSLRPKRDVQRTLHLQIPHDVLPRTKSVRVTLSFEDGDQEVIQSQDQTVELADTSDVQSLSVNLKIDLAQ